MGRRRRRTSGSAATRNMTRFQRFRRRLIDRDLRGIVLWPFVLVVAIIVSVPLSVAGRETGQLDEVPTQTGLITLAIFNALYVLVTVAVFSPMTGTELSTQIRVEERIAQQRRKYRWTGLTGGNGHTALTYTAALAALAGVLLLVLLSDERPSLVSVLVSVAVVASSWALIAVSRALEYTRVNADERSLRFPEGRQPVFADYLSFSMVISSSASPSGAEIYSTRLRTIVRWHCVLAFIYNTGIIAVVIAMLTAVALSAR